MLSGVWRHEVEGGQPALWRAGGEGIRHRGPDVSLWSAAGNGEESQHPDPMPSSVTQKRSVVRGPPDDSKDLPSLFQEEIMGE